MGFDFNEVMRRAIKYLVEGFSVALALWIIGKGKMKHEEIALVALTAASVYAVIDTLSPSSNLGHSTRLGSGLAIGSSLAGGFKMM